MEEKLGIKELKEALSLALSIGELSAKLMDGIGVDDAMALMEVIQKLPAGLTGIDKVIPEFKDVDDAEKHELKAFIESDFDIENDKIEEAIEWGLKLVVDLSSIFKVFKK